MYGRKFYATGRLMRPRHKAAENALGWTDFGQPDRLKSYRMVSVESRADLSSTMRLAVSVADGRVGTREPAEGDLTLVSTSAVWGLAFWDAFEWSRVYTPRAPRAGGDGAQLLPAHRHRCGTRGAGVASACAERGGGRLDPEAQEPGGVKVANDYYSADDLPVRFGRADAEGMSRRLRAIAAGFDKLPTADRLKRGLLGTGTDQDPSGDTVAVLTGDVPYGTYSGYLPGQGVGWVVVAANTGAVEISVDGGPVVPLLDAALRPLGAGHL